MEDMIADESMVDVARHQSLSPTKATSSVPPSTSIGHKVGEELAPAVRPPSRTTLLPICSLLPPHILEGLLGQLIERFKLSEIQAR